jgi:hypothetical protein
MAKGDRTLAAKMRELGIPPDWDSPEPERKPD